MSKQFGFKEVMNFVMYDFTTGDVILRCDYATDTSIETTAERIQVRGGQGNYKLLSFDHTKDNVMKGELALLDLNAIAHLTGKSLYTGAVSVAKFEDLTVSAGNQITLAATPTANLRLYIKSGSRDNGTEQILGNASTPNQYSITGNLVTLNSSTCASGSGILAYYDYSSSATSRTITFTADKFPSYVRITGDSFGTDAVTGEVNYMKIDIKKAKVKNNWSLTLKSTEVSKLSFEADIFNVDMPSPDGNGTDKVAVKLTLL